jgi:hypothetical protein
MTRILIDECLPVKLKYRFQEKDPDFLVLTIIDQKMDRIKKWHIALKGSERVRRIYLSQLIKTSLTNKSFQNME